MVMVVHRRGGGLSAKRNVSCFPRLGGADWAVRISGTFEVCVLLRNTPDLSKDPMVRDTWLRCEVES